jgi:hypothetical protein
MGFFVVTNAFIMIQRIQTIFLALIVVLFAALFFVPVFKITIMVQGIPLTSYRSLGNLDVLLLSGSIITLIALVAIFMFNNRKRQLLVVNVGMLLSLLLFTLCLLLPDVFSDAFEYTQQAPVVGYSIGTFIIALFPALFFFAGRNIKKDEKLIRDADRLR